MEMHIDLRELVLRICSSRDVLVIYTPPAFTPTSTPTTDPALEL